MGEGENAHPALVRVCDLLGRPIYSPRPVYPGSSYPALRPSTCSFPVSLAPIIRLRPLAPVYPVCFPLRLSLLDARERAVPSAGRALYVVGACVCVYHALRLRFCVSFGDMMLSLVWN